MGPIIEGKRGERREIAMWRPDLREPTIFEEGGRLPRWFCHVLQSWLMLLMIALALAIVSLVCGFAVGAGNWFWHQALRSWYGDRLW